MRLMLRSRWDGEWRIEIEDDRSGDKSSREMDALLNVEVSSVKFQLA
jgi:hypothetical protein